MLKKHIIAYSILLCTSSFSLPHVATTIAKDATRAYAILLGSVIVHELGHAMIAKALWNCPVKIVIGAATTKEEVGQPVFRLGPITFYSLNPWPAKGYAYIKGSNIAPYKIIASLAAGPIAGSLFSALIYKICLKEPITSFLSQVAAFTMLFGHLGNLIPDGSKNDGSRILEIYNLLRGKATTSDCFKIDSETKTISI